AVHAEVRRRFPFIARVAVASYDAEVGRVRTLADSSDGGGPLTNYEAPLAATSSLRRLLAAGRPRVVDDLAVFGQGCAEHTLRIRDQGYRASYTLPLSLNGVLWGFLFLDSTRPHVFTPEVLADLDVFAHLVSSLVTHELSTQRLLVAALTTAVEMVHRRDPETGAHLQRMARFARLIAEELGRRGAAGVDDEFVERVFLFAPLHDVGKIAIPDVVLRKPGRLTRQEHDLMKTHAEQGARIVDAIIGNFRLGTLPFVDMLRHVAELHHEAVDGSGYPRGLLGAAIPLEARIAAVADVFDALASSRVYKPAWPNARAFATLRRLAGRTLDPACVDALAARRQDVEAIQERF
ncbi:MAG TPA: HD domain-containing phosphohydrolase, partial [Methylomirabilota bacterium]|nr:HD domain-containing phosphohydrolase [Methylomirabilota bacterium]